MKITCFLLIFILSFIYIHEVYSADRVIILKKQLRDGEKIRRSSSRQIQRLPSNLGPKRQELLDQSKLKSSIRLIAGLFRLKGSAKKEKKDIEDPNDTNDPEDPSSSSSTSVSS